MGTYNTKQKTQILDFLRQHKGIHFTIDEIVTRLSESGIIIGKTTVYRYLEKLSSEKAVRKYEISKNDAACYEYCGETTENLCTTHYHLKCTVCNTLFHINCHILNTINEHILNDHNFTVDNTKTVFYGICHACKERD